MSHDKIGAVVGHLDDAAMLAVNRALAVFLGLALSMNEAKTRADHIDPAELLTATAPLPRKGTLF